MALTVRMEIAEADHSRKPVHMVASHVKGSLQMLMYASTWEPSIFRASLYLTSHTPTEAHVAM